MEEQRQAALKHISSAELADLDELTSSINARHAELVRLKAEEPAHPLMSQDHLIEVPITGHRTHTAVTGHRTHTEC